MASVLNVRSEMSWAMSNYFRVSSSFFLSRNARMERMAHILRICLRAQNEGFIKVEAPIITSSDCEGGGEVFKVIDATPPATSSSCSLSSSSPTSPAPPPPQPSRYLSVSSQLHLEAIASSHPRVYALSPCFRAEKSDTARHLQEFWMLEAELSFLSPSTSEALEQVMQVTEDSVREIAKRVVEMEDFEYLANSKNGQEVGLRERTEGLLKVEKYPRITYTEAVRRCQEAEKEKPGRFQFKPEWGASLQTEHEKYLAEELIKGPLFVTDYPTSLKPFYMLRNSLNPEEPDRQTTSCFDLLVPQLGELAGGSLRTHSAEELLETIESNPKMKKEDYDWYLDLRKYGTTRHGGFGLGWERLVGLLTGMKNVRECIAFPRAGEGSRF